MLGERRPRPRRATVSAAVERPPSDDFAAAFARPGPVCQAIFLGVAQDDPSRCSFGPEDAKAPRPTKTKSLAAKKAPSRTIGLSGRRARLRRMFPESSKRPHRHR
jgi:hypothetical protein